MKQYLDLCNRILTEGHDVHNERTGKFCRTVINATLTYDVGAGEFPLITTRKAYWKSAIAELLGYLRGYDNAADFRALGTKTWDNNANENAAWLANPHRFGVDDMGNCYGAVARGWPTTERDTPYIDTLAKVIEHLAKGIDDRGEIVTFWNPGEFYRGCLRPCMHTHQFSLLDGKLYLTSFQRSCDVPLGLVANMVQCYTLLKVVAELIGAQPMTAVHHIVNAHMYSDQIELMKEQVPRKPFASPKLNFTAPAKYCEVFEAGETPKLWETPVMQRLESITLDNFSVSDYKYHPAIKYPFSV